MEKVCLALAKVINPIGRHSKVMLVLVVISTNGTIKRPIAKAMMAPTFMVRVTKLMNKNKKVITTMSSLSANYKEYLALVVGVEEAVVVGVDEEQGALEAVEVEAVEEDEEVDLEVEDSEDVVEDSEVVVVRMEDIRTTDQPRDKEEKPENMLEVNVRIQKRRRRRWVPQKTCMQLIRRQMIGWDPGHL